MKSNDVFHVFLKSRERNILHKQQMNAKQKHAQEKSKNIYIAKTSSISIQTNERFFFSMRRRKKDTIHIITHWL